MSGKTLLCILGPTAVGKTAAAIELAKRLKTEIISADSRQFYKEVSIGTAKPSPAELAEVSHHFIGQLSIKDTYSAGDFERDALQKLDSLFKQHDTVIAVGGSGLYVKALIDGLDALPPANESLRTELHELFAASGIEALQQRLKRLNETAYAQTEIANPQRLMRAIEIETAVQNGFVNRSVKQNRTFRILKVVMTLPREILYERINQRVDVMMEQGLLEEVKSVVVYRNAYAMQTVGYTELFDYLDGKLSLEKAVVLIKQHTRNFAKRQLTWFRKEAPEHWFAPTDIEQILHLL
ncbi:MAG: tRNA (adenosine(37)-N6)-dimethylallyltransferase MiaA [Bacteroidota bacterium]